MSFLLLFDTIGRIFLGLACKICGLSQKPEMISELVSQKFMTVFLNIFINFLNKSDRLKNMMKNKYFPQSLGYFIKNKKMCDTIESYVENY